MDSRTAIVFGATGLVGKALVKELMASDTYSQVKVFVRTAAGFQGNEKLSECIIDFNNLNGCSDNISGDDLYIALGTTIKKAGSVAKMEEIDRDLPLRLASIASANRVSRLAVVSSIGADAGSRNYYLRIKGEMERRILDLNFKTVAIMRPSLLLGDRGEKRFGENFGKVVMKAFGGFLSGKLKKYRAIEATDVARAMLSILKDKSGKETYESDIIRKIADMSLQQKSTP